jgi:hypothetical protein
VNVTVVPTGPVDGLTVSTGATVKITVALFEAPSVPVNGYPPGDAAGIVNWQLNDPIELVMAEQAGPVAHVTATGEEAAYPAPEKVTTVPTGPVSGLAVSRGETVTVVLAALLDPSVAVKRWAPAVVGGTVKLQRKLPLTLVVAVHAVPPLQETVTGELPAYPVPLNVTVLPTGAGEGDGVEVNSGRTTRLVDAVLPAVSVPTNACDPAVAGGNVNPQEKLPAAEVVAVHATPSPQLIVTIEVPA